MTIVNNIVGVSFEILCNFEHVVLFLMDRNYKLNLYLGKIMPLLVIRNENTFSLLNQYKFARNMVSDGCVEFRLKKILKPNHN